MKIFGFFCVLATLSSSSDGHNNGGPDKRYNHMSPNEFGLRAANPLDELPPPDLIEPSARPDDPRPCDVNVTALRSKLGSNFDANFMSLSGPGVKAPSRGAGESPGGFTYRRNRLGRLIPTGTMPDYIAKMNFKYVTLSNGSKLRTRLSPKLKRQIQQFLWTYTDCSVVYKWKDLGSRFWPRYLKSGYCPINVSCSIPPGMTCRPSASTHKTLLRWHCKNYYGNQADLYLTTTGNARKHCQWIKVEYPVLTECSCSDVPSSQYGVDFK